jgi:hypothetical protein
LAAAAAVLLAVVSLVVFRTYDKDGGQPVYRTQEADWLHSVTPDGTKLAHDSFVLRWAAGPEGTVYDVRVTTEDLRVLDRARRLESAELRVPTSALADLESGARIFWQVTAHQPDGRTIESESFLVELE